MYNLSSDSDRQTYIHADRQTDKQTDRHTDRQMDRQTFTFHVKLVQLIVRFINVFLSRKDRDRERGTHGMTDRQTDRQTQTDGHTDR